MTLGSHEPPPTPASAPPVVLAPEPPKEAAVPKPPPKPTKRPTRVTKAEPLTPRATHPPVSAKNLIGLDQAAVRRLLGQPRQVKQDHLSLSWTYSAPGCSVRLIFYPSLDNASFHVLKFAGSDDSGAPLDSSDACVSGILIARRDAR